MPTTPSHPMPTSDPHPGQPADPVSGFAELSADRLDRLQRTRGYPLISVLAATTPRSRLATEDRRTLDRLIDTAESRLALELGGPDVGQLIGPLRTLADEISNQPMRHGLVLFHGAGVLEAHRLSRRPEPRVVIDPTFATRDLVREQLDNPPYRLLVLSSRTARLLVGVGDDLTERTRPPFPISAEEPDPDRRGHLHHAVRTHAGPRRWDGFVRTVDDALRADRDTATLPLVVAAAEPLASRLSNRSGQHIIGVVAGNHERTRPNRLAQLARPIVSEHLARQRLEALDELERAVSTRRAAFGVHEVWTAARDRRIVRLIVDPGYAQPVTTSADSRHITPVLDPEPPDVLDDAVDDIIEAVALQGGSVSFVPLTEAQGRIAAVLRTRQRRT